MDINFDSVKVDTIKSKVFTLIVKKLHSKLLSHTELNLEEDRTFVVLMNTLDWSGFYKQSFVKRRFPLLFSLGKIFSNQYKSVLNCKYSVCIGAGFTPYYKELHVQYAGNPVACDRYYIRD